MTTQYPYGKGCSTPVQKGLLIYCPSCINYITQPEQEAKIKYPCKLSHSQVRRGAGINYARDFKDCALYEERITWEGIKANYDKEYEAKFVATHSIAGKDEEIDL